MVKIQIIVCGWWFDGYEGKTTFIDDLRELQDSNSNISVFWSCHKEPPKIIKDNFIFNSFIYKREPVDEIIKRSKNTDILAISCYVWNWQISLKIAKDYTWDKETIEKNIQELEQIDADIKSGKINFKEIEERI